MSFPAQNKSFKGRHESRLDDKRRLTIPADWRFEGEGESSYLAFYHPAHAAIMVLPPKMKARIEAASERPEVISNPVMLRALERLGELSQDIVCDKAGRVMLRAEVLKAKLAELEKSIRGLLHRGRG